MAHLLTSPTRTPAPQHCGNLAHSERHVNGKRDEHGVVDVEPVRKQCRPWDALIARFAVVFCDELKSRDGAGVRHSDALHDADQWRERVAWWRRDDIVVNDQDGICNSESDDDQIRDEKRLEQGKLFSDGGCVADW